MNIIKKESIWFTSDTHFNHKNIFQFCPESRQAMRLNGDLELHDEQLIYNWNSCIKPWDRVYHLGDFSFGSADYTEFNVLGRLNGNIHFIYGNHDQILRNNNRFRKYFQSMSDYKEIRVGTQKICMFHFPMYEWHHCHRGSWHLFGHVHDTYGTVRGKSLNVGIDNRPSNDMMPWSYEEIEEFMKDKEVIGHH